METSNKNLTLGKFFDTLEPTWTEESNTTHDGFEELKFVTHKLFIGDLQIAEFEASADGVVIPLEEESGLPPLTVPYSRYDTTFLHESPKCIEPGWEVYPENEGELTVDGVKTLIEDDFHVWKDEILKRVLGL